MCKKIRFLSLLLLLLFALQLSGAATGAAFADGAPDADCAIEWDLSVTDEDETVHTFTTLEQIEEALGEGFALDWGKDDQEAPITQPRVADLRRDGVKITPPAGYTVSSLMITAGGAEPEEDSSSLLALARASVDGSSAVTLPAEIFAEDFDAASVGRIFNGSGSSFVLHISLARLESAEQITLRYTPGELAASFGDAALVAGGNLVTLPFAEEETAVSGHFAALDSAAAESALSSGKRFLGWKLILPGGANLLVQGGEPFVLAVSAELEAQWEDFTPLRPITFTVENASREYNGLPLGPSAYSISSGSLAEGHQVTADYHGQQTLPGSSTGTADFTIRDAEGNDVSDSYDIRVINGSITVLTRSEKQAITVTVSDAQKEYDGSSAVSASYAITDGSLLGNDRLSADSITGSITGVGTGSVGGSFSVLNGEADVSDNYEITVIAGSLTVRPRPIVLTADSDEKDYDGTPLTKPSFTLTSGTLIEGHRVTANVTGTQTSVGSSPNRIDDDSVRILDANDTNVTGLYSIRLVAGTLTVKGNGTPVALTVTMKDAEKVYDGKALTSKDYTITSGALAEGDTLVQGEVTGEQTEAGTGSVSAVFTVKHGESDVTANYTITVVPGKLTVKARPITVTAGSASKIHDGRALTSDSWKISSGELVKGHKLTASVSGSQTEIGSSANVVVKSSIKITDAAGKDVLKNYDVTTAAGTLTVSRDPVTPITLSLGEASKVYDGKPYRFLSADIKVSSGTLPSGYRIEATFNPEAPTDAGKYEITIKSVTIRNASGADVTSQFNISRLKGSLTISERPLTIETKAANKEYDGTALTERSTPNITGRVEGHQVTLRITGSQTKVGSSDNTVSDVKITDKETGADVTKNYAISYQYGKLTVTEASSGGSGSSSAYSWESGSSGTLFIKFDHSYDGFEGLQVDGKDLDRSAYSSASGSTEIWLKASYLNTLSSGTHTLTAKYAGGETVQTSFSVQGSRSARTGDSTHLGLWIVIMVTALLAAGAAAWYLFLGKGRRGKKSK